MKYLKKFELLNKDGKVYYEHLDNPKFNGIFIHNDLKNKYKK